MSAFDLEAMRSRNRVEIGVPFLAVVQGDELAVDAALIPEARLKDVLGRFNDEGRNPYSEEGED